MTDTHGMKFVVDTTGVAKGFRDYRSAVEGIFASLDKFEAHVEKTMKGVASAANNKTALNAFKSSMQGFGKVDIDTAAAKKLSALSAAMAGFKAPSAASSANTKSFFKALEGLPNLGNVYKSIKSIDDLNIAMRGFKAPSPSQAQNLVKFAASVAKAVPQLESLGRIGNLAAGAQQINTLSTALGRVKAPSVNQSAQLELFAHALKNFNFSNLSGSANLFASLSAISSFKAPSPAQIRNLQAFITAIGNLKVPTNANAIAASIANIAHAANSANSSLGGFRTNFGGFQPAFSRFNAGAKSATLNMAGLQNAFSGTFQVGSVLRSLLGSLTLGELGRSFFEATQTANAFAASMEVVSESPGFKEEMWKRISKLANDFGADIDTVSRGYGLFAISAKEAGVSAEDSFKIFKGFQTASTALHLDASKQQEVGLALQQIFNKGYIASEELTKQLNNALPGAMAVLNAAVKKASNGQEDLFTALKKKQIDAKIGLEVLSDYYSTHFGPAVAQALESPIQQFNILKNNLKQFMIEIGDAGAKKGFADLLRKISGYLNPADLKKYAAVIGKDLQIALDKAGKALDWLYVNWDKIKGPLATTLSLLGKWILVSTALKIGSTLVTPLIGVGRAATVAVPLIFDLVRASKALAAVNLTGYLGALSKIKNPAVAAGTAGLAAKLGSISAIPGVGAVTSGISKVPGLFATATKAVGGFAGAITTGLAAAWGIATGAQVDFADKAVSVNYSAGEIITGMWMTVTEWFGKAWGSVTEWFTKAWDDATSLVTGLGGWMKEQLGFNFSDIGDIAAKTGFVIYYGFKKSFDAIVGIAKSFGSIIGRTIGGIAGSLGKLFTGDAAGAAAAAKNVLTGGTIRDGWNDGMGGFSIGGDDLRNAYADTRRGANGVSGFLNDMGAKGRGKPKPTRRVTPPPVSPTAELFNPDLSGLLGAEAGKKGDKKKKGRKTPSLEDQENKVENAVDTLMKRLAGDDPVAKMYQDFVKGLTDEAHVLLSSNGYQDFLKNIQKDAKDGKVTVDSLIAALEKGNLDSKTMADLKKRYGTDVKGIIQLLREQQADYEDAVKEATIKALDKKYKQVKAAAEVLGEDNPGIKAQQDLIEGLTKLARITLPTDAFKEFATSLRDGSSDTSSAMLDLRDRITDVSQQTPQLKALLGSLGITADQLAASIDRLGVKTKYARMQAEEENTFGAKLLRTRQEQIMLNSLSARDSEIMLALQEEVTSQLAKGNQVSRETIEVTYQKLKAQQALADQMARNKTFFENNGVRSYINDVKDAGAAVNDLDKNVLQSLEDQLYSLGTTGKFSFKAIFDTIQQGIVRFASQQVTKKLVESIIPKDTLDGGSPTLFGGMFKAIGLGNYEPSKTQPLGSSVGNALWVQWTGQNAGGGIGGTGIGINEGGGTDTIMGGLYQGKLTRPQVTVEGTDGGPTNLLDGISGFSGAANDNSTVAKGNPLLAANDNATAGAVAKTAMSFKDSITGVLPMIGLAFAGSFKSPIAQIGALFASQIITKLIAGGGGGGGGGGLGGLLSGLFGGGGGGGGGGSSLMQDAPALFSGIFKEGGIAGMAVAGIHMSPSAFANAPHYSEGTHNTSGGIPAVLHDNEAVIPLSRNRKVPIEMKGGGGTHITQNYVINTPDANSFKKSKQQIAVDSYSVANRAFRRNH